MTQDHGASLRDRAVVPSASSPAVSPVPASIPSAMIRQLRMKAREFEQSAKYKRMQAKELEARAAEIYDAFISFDLLADKFEADLASAIEARRAETGTGSVEDESAMPKADAQTPPAILSGKEQA